jgi:hypothetical protein
LVACKSLSNGLRSVLSFVGSTLSEFFMVACKSLSNGLRSVLSFVGSTRTLNKSQVWSL